MESPPTITASVRTDIILFVLLVAAALFSSPRLRVYHNVTVIDVTAVRITPEGESRPLAIPDWMRQIEAGYARIDRIVPVLEQAVDRHLAGSGDGADRPGTRYEWTFRYSRNSMKLDQSYVVIREARDDGF